jgi:hypothetical protein
VTNNSRKPSQSKPQTLKNTGKKLLTGLVLSLCLVPFLARSQSFLENSVVQGNFQIDAQTYHSDDALGISDSSLLGKTFRMNAFGDIRYSLGKFRAGLRYEAYLPPLAGYDQQYEGMGVPYWFAEYGGDQLQITAGHFYEQFGSGLILRSYQQWDLGYDNNFYGIRVKYNPSPGIYLKGLVGTQRYYWEPYKDNNRGIVRAFDAEFVLNDIFKKMQNTKTRFIFGGSFVSKYEKVGQKTLVVDTTIYAYELPINVASYAGRLTITNGGFNFNTEYVYKYNNPSAFNNYIYKYGEALLATLSYSQKGLGVILSAKRIDNTSFKSKMTELGNVLDINFIPPLTKQHVYSLESIYPYATQLNGETAFSGDIIYTIPKNSKFGGKYGTRLELNYSLVHDINKQQVTPGIPVDSTGTLGYKSEFFSWGPLFYQDLNFNVEKKVGKSFKMILEYVNLIYNIDVIEGHPGRPNVHANIGVADLTYKFSSSKSLRMEYQMLFTEQDKGDWAMLLLEFNIAPRWFFSVLDQYNYGNPDQAMQLHYYTGSVAYAQGPSRISLSYGRQREGLLCVGGVCRQVPASNGFALSITTTF